MIEEKNEIIEQSGGKFSFKKLGRKMKKTIQKVDKTVDNALIKTAKTLKKGVYQTGDKIETKVNKTIDLAKRVINNTKQLPPYVQKFINQNGDNKIIAMTLCRSPVPIAIRKLMVGLSGAKDRVLYHLFLIVTMQNGKKFIMEKNERINVSYKIPKATQTLQVNENFDNIIVSDLFSKTQKLMGNKKYFNYNSSSSNCQVFIANVLKANGLLNDQYYAFIKQETADLFARDGNLRRISNTVVNEIAGRANILFSGGHLENKILSNNRKMNPWLIHVKDFRQKHPQLSYKQVLMEAKKTYTKK